MKIEKTKPKKSISEVVRFTNYTVCCGYRYLLSEMCAFWEGQCEFVTSVLMRVHVFSALGNEGADISTAGVL